MSAWKCRIRALSLALLVALVAWTSAAAQAQAAPAYRGLTVHSLAPDHWPDMERDLDAMQEVGADVVRVDVSWYTLEATGKESYESDTSWYLDRLDTFVAEAATRGLKVVPALWQTPC